MSELTELEALNPCPKCGKLPKLKEAFKYAWSEPKTDESLFYFHYECRLWFGLRLCLKAPYVCIAKGRDLGSYALEEWNKACLRYQVDKAYQCMLRRMR